MKKHCSKCKIEFDIEQFTVKNKKTGRLASTCRSCYSLLNKAYREKNRDRINEKAREIYLRDHDKEIARAAEKRKTLSHGMNRYRQAAKERGYSWELTVEDLDLFYKKPCVYCRTILTSLGIDRVDNSIGYRLSNCVPCCTMCNKMKLDHDKDTWLDHMELILRQQGRI